MAHVTKPSTLQPESHTVSREILRWLTLLGDVSASCLHLHALLTHVRACVCVHAGEDEDNMVDGWDMVQRPAGWGSPSNFPVGTFQTLGPGPSSPLLPPTPSQVDDVAHWERAMFTDATATAAAVTNARSGVGSGGVVSPAALERTLVAAANMLATPLLPFQRASQQ